MKLTRAFACWALAASLSCAAQGHEKSAQELKDFKEIQSCNLTMDLVTRTFQTMYEMKQVIKSDPALMEQERKNAESDDQQKSLDQMAAIIGGSPRLTATAAAHGFTPRSLVVAELSVATTAAAMMAASAGATESDLVNKANVNLANLKLLQAHQAEIEALSKKYPTSGEPSE